MRSRWWTPGLRGDHEGLAFLLDNGDCRTQAHILASWLALYLRASTPDALAAIAELRPVLLDPP